MAEEIVILDFGSQFTQLIARAVRAQGVYCEIEPYSITIEKLKAKQPQALHQFGSFHGHGNSGSIVNCARPQIPGVEVP